MKDLKKGPCISMKMALFVCLLACFSAVPIKVHYYRCFMQARWFVLISIQEIVWLLSGTTAAIWHQHKQQPGHEPSWHLSFLSAPPFSCSILYPTLVTFIQCFTDAAVHHVLGAREIWAFTVIQKWKLIPPFMFKAWIEDLICLTAEET